MGQKVNPIGFRVAVNKNWRSRWYAEKRQYGDFFHEDLKIRELIMKWLAGAAVPEVIIEQGPMMRRHWSRSRGMARPVTKRTSHIRVVLVNE